MKILVVDDSRTMRKVIRRALEDMGYSAARIIEASDGVEAIARLREHKLGIDIILADWNMPRMDGLTLLKRLQKVERLRQIPFIMITGEAERGRVVEAIREGARNYIVKPFSMETLRQKVLSIEVEFLARRKPSDTAVLRLTAAREAQPDANLPFVTQLPEELVARIYERAEMNSFPASETLIEPDDVVEALRIIDKGEVDILAEGDGSVREVRGLGDCFGELSFLTGDPAGLGVRARTEVVIASVEKNDFEDLIAEYPHLTFYLTRLLARCARKADEKLVSGLKSSLSGELTTMALAELVQALHSNRKTGLLHIESGGQEGEIYFEGGDVRHARAGEAGGEKAFYRLVSWTEGSFVFEAGKREIEPDVFRVTTGLLIEGMRRQDELVKMQTQRESPA